jgi:CRISPR-associated endonuclease Cas2
MKMKVLRLSKEILKYLLLAGVISVAATSPYFVFHLTKNIWKQKSYKPNKRKITDAFSYLKRRGLIEVKKENHDIQIALTEEGRKRAGKYQIDDLEIRRPSKWDRRWRVIIFDIPNSQKIKRNAFRRKLKEFGFYSLQKSVWVHPFNCQEEINLLRDFFGLDKKQIQVLLVDKIETELLLRKAYKL